MESWPSIWPEYLEWPPRWPIIEFDLFIHASQGLIMAYTRTAVLHYGLDSYLRLPMQHFNLLLYLKDGDLSTICDHLFTNQRALSFKMGR